LDLSKQETSVWTIAIVVVVVLVVFIVAANLRARSVVKRHATTLSGITGIPAQQIAREMIDGNQTPGEWASRHGLGHVATVLDALIEGSRGVNTR
jgi:hypothetical protein